MRREQFSEEFWQSVAWSYRDDEHRYHSDAYLLWNRDQALRNYDISMSYFASLDRDEFEAALDKVLTAGKSLKPVDTLADWNETEGVYVMVFDEYKQFYVGKANDIRRRIKDHWGARKPFDRLIFGTVYDSVLPLDELRILDTTRIYAARSSNPFSLEQRLDEAADGRFTLNRIGGGEGGLRLFMRTLQRHTRGTTTAQQLDTWELIDAARADIDRLTSETRAGLRTDLVEQLAGMDMQIYANTRQDGTQAIWSRRDIIGNAIRDGSLTISEFEAFLTTMGETVIWPKEKQTR
jgi:hypothetical protein